MSFINLYDSHTHSDNSPDGSDSVTYLCEYAIAHGLRGLAVTDHCEMDAYEDGRFKISIRQSKFEVRKAKSVFRGRLIVSCGVELGQPLSNVDAIKEVLTDDIDFVLGSMHNSRDGKDYYYADYSSINVYELLADYFDDVLALCEWNGFDSLAHLTYPIRYITGKHGIKVDMSRFDNQIDNILKVLVKNKKALEINTSGLRGELGETVPTLKYIKRFKELGGEYVTIGSDGHKSVDVGANIEDGMALALEAGFNQFAIYLSREPMMIDIK